MEHCWHNYALEVTWLWLNYRVFLCKEKNCSLRPLSECQSEWKTGALLLCNHRLLRGAQLFDPCLWFNQSQRSSCLSNLLSISRFFKVVWSYQVILIFHEQGTHGGNWDNGNCTTVGRDANLLFILTLLTLLDSHKHMCCQVIQTITVTFKDEINETSEYAVGEYMRLATS